jgi:ankyrin repeat protein
MLNKSIPKPFLPYEIIDEILLFTQDILVTIALGRFEILSKMFTGIRPLSWAIQNGHVKYLEYLCRYRNVQIDRDFRVSCRIAIKRNHLKVLEFCHSRLGGITTLGLVDYAAGLGNLDIIEYLHSIGSRVTTKAMDKAAGDGHLKVVKWLHENRLEGCSKEAMDSAALNGHLDVLSWLHQNRNEGFSTKAMYGAVLYGHLEVVKFLFEIGSDDEDCLDAVRLARGNGQTEVVEYFGSVQGITT